MPRRTDEAGSSGSRRVGASSTLADADAASDADQTASDADQTASDADQTASDADQTASDTDAAASASDQESADREQIASDEDQAASDRDRAAGREDEASYQASRHERKGASETREGTATHRADASLERNASTSARDEAARRRDLTAFSRDRAAESRDRSASLADEALLASSDPGDGALRSVLAAGEAVRRRAASDRARAAGDRRRAGQDRADAAADRGKAQAELERAQLDGLTGVYMRDLGRVTLEHEITRSRRSGEPFVLAFVDVDGLKAVNDGAGHPAGDALLQEVVGALESRLRSYDPIVRFGGDEFLCGFTNADLAASQRRAAEIRLAVESAHEGGSVAIGLAALGADDTLDDLIARADADMYAQRRADHDGG